MELRVTAPLAASPLLPVDTGWVYPELGTAYTPAEQHPPPSGALTVAAVTFDDVSRVQGFHDLTVDDQKVVKARFHRLLGQPDTPAPAAKKKKGSKPKKKRPSAPAAAAGAKRKADDDASSPAKKAKPETLPVSTALFSPGTPGALGL